ncbi:ABC transporter substrate-binding protein [Nocardioides sp. CFH 31398]|uniref:ABC transporter substrate-binding protein n=1 Tax=Nocardioides sp. CFH 31398 TaxID=2919579 RepID=UPI001F05066D|nr:ABC transporter substrate-binding protein [Nocardioides sp. CFH 31398]MCH1867388.1 ABC transporter substrate-binding protein [Nocardioides sp. CFH 31398]MCH1868615.1 ABC transporter substrate-binding protein [Nocardioides sp. CFH 31398]
MKRSKSMAAVAGAAALFTLAACGGGGGGGDQPQAGEGFQEGGAAGELKDPEAQGPAEPIEGAEEGGTLNVLLPLPDEGPTTLDPTAGWSVTDNSILQNLVFRSLTTFKYDYETDEMVLVPDLATDLGTPNDDFTEWTFTIKDGIRWENGDPVTAEDVAFGMKRSLSESADLQGPGTKYSKTYFAGGKDYAGPYEDGEDFPAITVDGSDITIEMSQPFPEMDYWGSFMAMGPVPSGPEGEAPGYGNAPLATGPYKVAEFRAGEILRLERNDEWDPNTDASRHQYPDEYVFEFGQDTTASDQVMLNNTADSETTVLTALQGSSYQQATENLGDRVVPASQACTSFWNPDYEKIDEIEVRQALAFAYPYEDAAAAAGEIPGLTRTFGEPILPPGMAGREDYEAIPGETIETDPERARELLAEAGYEPGEYEIRFSFTNSTPEGRAAKEQIETALEDAGFATQAFGYGGSPYDVWTDPDNNIYQELNVRGVAWCSDWPSASTFIPALFESGQEYNTGNFSEQEVDDRIGEISSLPVEEQPAAWADLDRTIRQDYFPTLTLGYLNNLFAYGERVGNFQNDAAQGFPNWRDMYVVPE